MVHVLYSPIVVSLIILAFSDALMLLTAGKPYRFMRSWYRYGAHANCGRHSDTSFLWR